MQYTQTKISSKINQFSPHPVLLLVALVEGVLGLASDHIHFGAHGVRIAGIAGVFPLPPWLAVGGWLVLDQTVLDQTVSRRLENVQRESLDAALEKATLLFAVFGKTGLLLEKQSLKTQMICDRNLHILHIFGNTLCCFVE